ncbi:DNA ligase (ATP) [Malassezia cuniculi]|uniref:DNA ligase (ATP) n=1 Tax=Malassezia cuniculi TaxID=948313 RepID=A0AAF0EWN3_9BASI|nr:DNA ligase (ATP) [Malassezia cuniculi]
MSETSVFENARLTHEEIEQYEEALANTLSTPPHSSSHRLQLQWKLAGSSLLDGLVARYQTLAEIYNDPAHEMRAEYDALASQDETNVEEGPFAEFYERLGRLNEYYRKYPERAVALNSSAGPSLLTDSGLAEALDMTVIDREFSGEELGGRFLDLYVPYDAFINLKGTKRLSYLDYISSFDRILTDSEVLPTSTKRTEAYQAYISQLRAYLDSFLHKTRPLEDMDIITTNASASFDAQWPLGQVPGWPMREDTLYPSSRPSEDGIWCSACKKSYAKQTVYDAHLESARHKKMAARGDTQSSTANSVSSVEQAKRALRAKLIARDEALVRAYGLVLMQIRDETRANVERKASLTEREREEEAEQLIAEQEEALVTGGMGYYVQDGEDERPDHVYNPLKLPLGWDGKPIPFWLFKMQGLSVGYTCEICSDHVYHGRQNFEKHFQESRHSFGMRALGLPNTVEFRDITRIKDAFALAEKLRRENKLEAEDEADMEEIEDEHGNAYTRKNYELLKRQGII